MALKAKEIRKHQATVRLSDIELEVLEKLAKYEDRKISELLRVCFIRQARLSLPSSALKSLQVF